MVYNIPRLHNKLQLKWRGVRLDRFLLQIVLYSRDLGQNGAAICRKAI
ncbi:unnamed protein product [Rhodiola kirilowii]